MSCRRWFEAQEVFVTEHISTEIIERYRRRQVEPDELLSLDGHLAHCDQCRQQLLTVMPLPATPNELQNAVLAVADESNEHLSDPFLRSHLNNRLDAVDRELVESHLEFCERCQSQFSRLQSAHDPIARLNIEKQNWMNLLFARLTPRLALQVAGATALLVLLAWGIFRWQQQPNPSEILTRNPSPSPSVPQQPILSPQTLLALNDGGKAITLYADGTLIGIESLSDADQQAIKLALSLGKLETPKTLIELKSSASTLMAAPTNDPAQAWAADASSTLVSPVTEMVAENKPWMVWKPLNGAETYQVTINDPAANYSVIATSPKLTTIRWQPPSLPRGKILIWQVTATWKDSDGQSREITAPAPEAPEAKFRLLTLAQAEELTQAKRNYAGQHLAMGLLYARMGLLKDAERELQALATANPNSTATENLIRELQSIRKGLKPTK